MSNIANDLKRNEEVISPAKVHWTPLFLPIVLFIISIMLTHTMILPILFAIIAIWTFLSLRKTQLVLTNQRLIGKYGIISTLQMDSPLNKIVSISVHKNFFGRILGYSTIVVSTASTIYNFKYIRNSDQFKHTVLEEMDNFEETKIKNQAAALAGVIK